MTFYYLIINRLPAVVETWKLVWIGQKPGSEISLTWLWYNRESVSWFSLKVIHNLRSLLQTEIERVFCRTPFNRLLMTHEWRSTNIYLSPEVLTPVLMGKARLKIKPCRNNSARPGDVTLSTFCSALSERAKQINKWAATWSDVAPKSVLFWREMECDKMKGNALCNWPQKSTNELLANRQTVGDDAREQETRNYILTWGTIERGNVFRCQLCSREY